LPPAPPGGGRSRGRLHGKKKQLTRIPQDPPPASIPSTPRDRTALGGPGPEGVSPARPPHPAPSSASVGSPAPAASATPKPPAPRGRPPARTLAFWDKFYATHDESPSDLLETIALLRREGRFQDVEAILRGFLRYHSPSAEAWMYEMLAVTVEYNQGEPADVHQALIYAAQLAGKGNVADNLVTIADLLYLRGYYHQAAPLLDQAMEKIPHRVEPLLMAMNLAQKTKDPKRMTEALGRLLALGWPGRDEALRAEARRQAQALARTLREDGRATEAGALLGRLAEAEARDLYVRLTWTGRADLDLVVDEPLGVTARYVTPRTVLGGAIVKNGRGKDPEEIYVCPRAFDGDYTIRIETVVDDPERAVTEARLEIITHEGAPAEQKQTRTISVAMPEPVVVHLQGGRRKAVLPYEAPPLVVVRPGADRKGSSAPASAAAPPAPASRPGPGTTPTPAPSATPSSSPVRPRVVP
jgi:tetratricopeptide (TPR) repeat protein